MRPTPTEAPAAERADNGHGHLTMGLQRRAPRARRRHLVRAAIRLVVLVCLDLSTFWMLRALWRFLADQAGLGAGIAGITRTLIPGQHLDGWQFGAALVLGLAVTGNYGAGDRRRDPTRLLMGCALATALPLWRSAWEQGLELVAAQYVVTTFGVWAALLVARLSLEWLDARVLERRPESTPTLLVGTPEACREVAGRRAFAHRSEHAVLGFVDTGTPADPGALGEVGALPVLVQEHGVETVVICGPMEPVMLAEVMDSAVTAGCHVYAIPQTFDVPGANPVLVWKRGQPLVELAGQTLKAQQYFLKRLVDVLGAAAGFVLISPLLAVLALVVKLDSPGPVIFRQRRAGLGGRPFQMLKFRTMRDGADGLKEALSHLNLSGDPRLFKIQEDPRATRVGRWMRRWSLDELPQLWNVLRGEMSLVGPRPFFESDLDYYEMHHFVRLGAKPGITGLWQVSGRSDIVDFEEVVALDSTYVREWSLFLDLRILALTAPAVFRRKGAA